MRVRGPERTSASDRAARAAARARLASPSSRARARSAGSRGSCPLAWDGEPGWGGPARESTAAAPPRARAAGRRRRTSSAADRPSTHSPGARRVRPRSASRGSVRAASLGWRSGGGGCGDHRDPLVEVAEMRERRRQAGPVRPLGDLGLPVRRNGHRWWPREELLHLSFRGTEGPTVVLGLTQIEPCGGTRGRRRRRKACGPKRVRGLLVGHATRTANGPAAQMRWRSEHGTACPARARWADACTRFGQMRVSGEGCDAPRPPGGPWRVPQGAGRTEWEWRRLPPHE